MFDVEFWKVHHGEQVIVRGRRVPMLEAWHKDGGKVLLVFDGRLALRLTAENYEVVIAFVADVMENVMDPQCGRTFNRVHEITVTATEEGPDQ